MEAWVHKIKQYEYHAHRDALYEKLYHWLRFHVFWILGGKAFSITEMVKRRWKAIKLNPRMSREDLETCAMEYMTNRHWVYQIEYYTDDAVGWQEEVDYILESQVPQSSLFDKWLNTRNSAPRTFWELHEEMLRCAMSQPSTNDGKVAVNVVFFGDYKKRRLRM